MSFKNVKFGIFKQLFSRGRCSYVPENFCPSDASIVVTSKDAAGIFGATKAGSLKHFASSLGRRSLQRLSVPENQAHLSRGLERTFRPSSPLLTTCE